jgi:hypothetical protein
LRPSWPVRGLGDGRGDLARAGPSTSTSDEVFEQVQRRIAARRVTGRAGSNTAQLIPGWPNSAASQDLCDLIGTDEINQITPGVAPDVHRGRVRDSCLFGSTAVDGVAAVPRPS